MKNENRMLSKLSIIIPCLNEEGNVEELYIQLLKQVCNFDYTLLFIDDGSTDNTVSKIKKIAKSDNKVQFISFSKNFGHQNALKAGYDYTSDCDCVISMDADLQHPPEVITSMIKKWQEGYDIINTTRAQTDRIPFFKKKLAAFFYIIINMMSKTTIIPNGPDFRLLDKKVVGIIMSLNESSFFLRELIPWMGFKQVTIPFDVNTRHSGKSNYRLKQQLSFSIKGFVSSSINPLRLSIILGIVFGLLSFAYGFYSIYAYFFLNNIVPGWTSIIASILFIAGLQFFLLGIIGEYLGKTFLETRKRPLYIINQTNITS